MALRVPTYGGSQVSASPTPNLKVNVQTSTESFGGGEGAQKVSTAAQSLLQNTAELVAKEKRSADQISVLNADKKLSSGETDILYNDKDGFLNKTGENALKDVENVYAAYDKHIGDVEATLGNDEQRAVFQRQAASRRDDLTRTVEKHVAVERRKLDDSSTSAYVDNEMQTAVANYIDTDRVNISIQRQRDQLFQYGERNGIDKEVTKQAINQSVSKTHSLIVNRYLNSEMPNADTAAQKYYNDNKEAIIGTDREVIEKSLEAATLRGESQRKSDDILNAGGSMSQALEKARAIDDPKLRDETVRRVKDRYQEKDAALEESQKTAHANATSVLYKYKGDMDKLPINIMTGTQLNPSQKANIKALSEQLKAGTKPAPNGATYYDIEQLSAVDRDSFLKINLPELSHKMTDGELSHLITRQADMRQGKDSDVGETQSKTQIINRTLTTAGVDVTPDKGSDDAKKYDKFYQLASTEMNKAAQDKGKKLSEEEKQKIVDKLIEERTVKGSGFNVFGHTFFESKTPTYEQMALHVNEIEPDKLNEIKTALKLHSIPVNEESIMQAYRIKMRQEMNGQ